MVFPNAPTPLSYGPPQLDSADLDFTGKFFKSAEDRRKYDLARAFQGGVPKDAQGNPDFRAMADVLAQHGATDQAIPLNREAIAEQERAALQGAPAGGGAPGPQISPPQQSLTPPPGPTSGVRVVPPQPALSSAGTDNAGAQTMRALATELAGGKEVGSIIKNVATGLKVDPDAPLTPEQEAQLKPILARSIASLRPQEAAPAAHSSPPALLPSGADPRNEIAKLRAAGENLLRVAGDRGKGLAQQYFDRADRIESDAFGEIRRSQGNIDRAFEEQKRQHDLLASKPISVSPGSQLVDPQSGVPKFASDTGLLDKPTIDAMARQAMSGDTSVFTNLGRGAQGAENVIAVRKRIAELNSGSGESGAEQAQRNAEFFGVKAGQRTLGTRSANIELAATEFKQVLPVVQAASKAVSRTNYPDLNKIIQMFEEKTGDPNVVKFGGGVNTLVNLYARAISPSGNPTVSDKDHARLILNRAWSQGQFDAAVGMMSQEIDAALSSPDAVRDAMRKRFLEGQGGAKAPAGATNTPPAAAPAQGQPAPAGKPPTVIQNGHTYTLQPDGSYK